MSGIRRPKTAAGGAATLRRSDELPRRSGSQMSLRVIDSDESCWPQYVLPIRRVPSAMKRSMEIQTDSNSQHHHQHHHHESPPAAAVSVTGEPATGGGALFYPYYVPGLQQSAGGQGQLQQPFVLLSPWQLPGYHSLPVLDASQLKLLEPVAARRPSGFHPLDGAPIHRSGRNGSCWRHIKQCTGNLGNNIMFIDGHVKEEDCQRFPPHGYPNSSTAGLSVYNRLAPKSQPRFPGGISPGIPAGIPLRGFLGVASARQTSQSLALERAKTGTKYWYEDRKPAPLVPNSIQGRIMKSGSAY